MTGMRARLGLAALGTVLGATALAAAPAAAGEFAVRTAGAATAIAIDQGSVRQRGPFRTGWTYELYRERNPLTGPRVQIMGVLELVDCRNLRARRLKVAHFFADGREISHTGPEPAWTESLRGSNTDLLLRAMCSPGDPVWARRQAQSVFELYRMVWR
jgi:hypothetical protein